VRGTRLIGFFLRSSSAALLKVACFVIRNLVMFMNTSASTRGDAGAPSGQKTDKPVNVVYFLGGADE
jgi:hypothetical protein